jgi:hypothetical protein
LIRQFVAMPLGAGYTAEEQLTGEAEHGGLQIQVFPMKRKVFDKLYPKVEDQADFDMLSMSAGSVKCICEEASMGLAPGGLMRQQIYDDPHGLECWDMRQTSRCFIHLANSMLWRQITGESPPTTPPTAKEYTDAGLPWFDYYSDKKAVEGSKVLSGLKSVANLGNEKGEIPLPENQSVSPDEVVVLRQGLGDHQVREGEF